MLCDFFLRTLRFKFFIVHLNWMQNRKICQLSTLSSRAKRSFAACHRIAPKTLSKTVFPTCMCARDHGVTITSSDSVNWFMFRINNIIVIHRDQEQRGTCAFYHPNPRTGSNISHDNLFLYLLYYINILHYDRIIHIFIIRHAMYASTAPMRMASSSQSSGHWDVVKKEHVYEYIYSYINDINIDDDKNQFSIQQNRQRRDIFYV